MKQYTALYVYTDTNQNQLVGAVKPIETIETNTRSDAGELVSFGSGKSIARLVFRGIISLMYRLPAFKEAARQKSMKII